MTLITWFRSEATSGSIFSKSYPTLTDKTTTDFFDLRVGPGSTLVLALTLDTTLVSKTVTSGYAVDTWTHVGLRVDFDKETMITTVTPVVNGVETTVLVYSDHIILDKLTSLGAVGARQDGNGADFTRASYFTGYIYQLKIVTSALATSEIQAEVTTSCDDGFCALCPALHNLCLWDCAID
jgi:hypothetical protein